MTRDIEFEDLLEYKATYSQRPPEDLKTSQCLLLISLGQPQHEGTKLKAACRLIDATFGKCIVVVADSLNRHSLAINNLDMTKESLYKLSLERGQAWIDRNQPNIDQCLTISHQILRWDHWLDTESYRQYRNVVDRLYDTDADYNKAINENAQRFVNNFIQKQEVANHKRAVQCSVEYLMEESAIIAGVWNEEGYKAVVYPGVNVAVVETMKLFKSKILWLTYRLNSRKSTALSFQNIIDASPAHIYWKDSKGVYLGCNKATLQYAKLTNPEEFIGKTDFDMFDGDFANHIRSVDVDIMTKGEPTVIKERDSQGNTFLSHKSPLKNHENEVIGIIGNSINITAQEEAEQRLIQRTRELDDANEILRDALELKERVLRNVSHEIRTPLTGMSGIAEGTLDMWSSLTDEEKRDNLAQVVKCQSALIELVIKMLDIAKLKSGTEELVIEKNDMVKLARDIVDELSKTSSNILLEFEPVLDAVVYCDRIKMLQVLRNLVGNAIKYSKKDSPISLSIKQTKDSQAAHVLEISITDQGIGVPEDELCEIFQPFHESKRTRRQEGGTGLGLSICKEIVDAHGGKIWAQSNKVGATFIFTIPATYTPQTVAVSQVTLKQFIENVPGHLYWKDLDGKVRACNREQAQDAGYDDIEGWIGKTNHDLNDSDDTKKMLDETDRRVIEEGIFIQIEEAAAYREG